MSNVFESADVIFEYSRAQAIEDGELFDVTDAARSKGLTLPTAVTRTVWERYVKVPESLSSTQDEVGRLNDILSLLVFTVVTAPESRKSDRVDFELYCQTGKVTAERGEEVDDECRRLFETEGSTMKKIRLQSVCGPGDDGEPVITIMVEGDD